MTGKIKLLNTESASGCIDAENGRRLHFDSCAVLAYDATFLAVGQLVTFDLEKGSSSRAVNICVQRTRTVPHVEGKKDINSLRYMGFDQVASIRSYKFERTAMGEETEMFVVTTDLTLFAKHHVGIQEGPTLCLHLLTAELGSQPPRPRNPSPQQTSPAQSRRHRPRRLTPLVGSAIFGRRRLFSRR